jgi:sugar-specific transcriptional regulator TrmB
MNMLQQAKNQLIGLGLKDNEAEVYLACYRKPQGVHVHEIVALTNLKRSSIDVVIQRLIERGFIVRHKEGQRWLYRAEQPEKIAFSIEEKIADFKSAIPDFVRALGGGLMPGIRFYEGVVGVSSVYNDILLTAPNEIYTISSGRDLIKLLPGHHKQFIKKRISRDIHVRLLAPNNELSRKIFTQSNEYLRQTKFFDDATFQFKMEINIYANKVALIGFNDPGIMATVIESADIASSFKTLFEMVWTSASSQ